MVTTPALSPKQTLDKLVLETPPLLTSSTFMVTSLELASEHAPD